MDEGDVTAYGTIAGGATARLFLVCDHATNAMPASYAGLGLPARELARHIAYDPGAAALTRALAARLDAPAVLSGFSRLLIDPNRGEQDPTLIMRLSDGAVVPGNARIGAAEREARLARFHRPYHAAIDAALDALTAARGAPPVLVSLHSFTPVWRGRTRPWQCGILWDRDPRLAVPLIEALGADPALTVGDNEPYSGRLRGDCMYRHGTMRGIAHALIEVRQDLIADEDGVAAWAARLSTALNEVSAAPRLHEIAKFGSYTD